MLCILVTGGNDEMSLDAYKIKDSLLEKADLKFYGEKLIEFSNMVYKEKNRATIVRHFYEQLLSWSVNKLHFFNLVSGEGRKYFICDGIRATMCYLSLFIPQITSTVKTINEIRVFGESLTSKFIEPVGRCVSESSLECILNFLDSEYSFSSKVFSKSEAVFLILHNTHKVYNSECLSINDNEHSRNLFFLYHMKKVRTISPEAVLFHELGHALHAQYSGDVKKVPDNIIDILHNLCFPDIKQIDASEQSELFADVLGLGLMYQTPFDKYDHYKKIHPKDKKAFKTIVEKIIDCL